MLIYLECEDRAQRTPFLRLMVLLTFFNTNYPRKSSFQQCVSSLFETSRFKLSYLLSSILPSSCNIEDFLLWFQVWFLEAAVVFFSSFVEIYIFSILEVCRSSPRLPVPPRGIIVLTMQVWSGLFRQINIYQFSHRRPYGW